MSSQAAPETRARADIEVYDTTLRDGAQQEGMNLSVADKMAIAVLLDELGVHFNGMDRYACREAIVKELDEKGFLVSVEPYTVGLGRCYRCKDVVEPIISKQWFVRVGPLAKNVH